MNRDPSPLELAEDLAELKAMLLALSAKIDDLPFVRTDVYSAKHHALRNEITAELTRVHMDIEAESKARDKAIRDVKDSLVAAVVAVDGKADSARVLSFWAVGLICASVIGAIITYALAAGGS